MGFFSKLTADTNESIPSFYVATPKPVYLLQPGGKPPIKEYFYEGYGQIGGETWFMWLTTMNAERLGIDLDSLSDEEKDTIGIALDVGSLLRDKETDQLWSIFHLFDDALGDLPVNYTYSERIPLLGKSANELIEEGRFERVSIQDIVPDLLTVKLSHNADAIYENLPTSLDCPYQGYFYPDEMINSGNFRVNLDDKWHQRMTDTKTQVQRLGLTFKVDT